MKETSGISFGKGISPTMNQYRGSDVYSHAAGAKKSKSFQLRNGEIIHGRVLNVPREQEAIVRLPIGTLNAQLHGNLKKGDELFFQVMKSDPGLVLRVYAASVVSGGKEIAPSEILRMLDLPQDRNYTAALKFLKLDNSTIAREELLFLVNSFHQLSSQIVKTSNINDLFRALLFFREYNLALDNNIFARILPGLTGLSLLSESLEELETMLRFLPDTFSGELKKIFDKMKSGKMNIRESIFLMQISKDSGGIYSKLVDMLNDKTIEKSIMDRLRTPAENIIRIIEAQYLLNSLSVVKDSPYYLLAPFYMQNSIKMIQMVVKDKKDKKRKKSKQETAFQMLLSMLGKVRINLGLDENELNASINVSDAGIRSYIEKNMNTLKQQFINNDIDINSIKVAGYNEGVMDFFESKKPLSTGNLSVVV
jgi:flagellar hook-length control protein FliK